MQTVDRIGNSFDNIRKTHVAHLCAAGDFGGKCGHLLHRLVELRRSFVDSVREQLHAGRKSALDNSAGSGAENTETPAAMYNRRVAAVGHLDYLIDISHDTVAEQRTCHFGIFRFGVCLAHDAHRYVFFRCHAGNFKRSLACQGYGDGNAGEQHQVARRNDRQV